MTKKLYNVKASFATLVWAESEEQACATLAWTDADLYDVSAFVSEPVAELGWAGE